MTLAPRLAEGRSATGDDPGSLSYNKVCTLEDFAHPQLRPLLRTIFSGNLERYGPDFPTGREVRKEWEVAMAVRTLGDHHALHPQAEILGVGAGAETTIFWLTRYVKRVFATDIYLEAGEWSFAADASMLTDPGRHAHFPWRPRRLVVQHMDARELRYEDESFDGIFSSGSIEHFGTIEEIRRSAEEMFRVLRPGGVLSLSTEFRLEGPPPGLPGIVMFDAEQLDEYLVGGLDWTPVSAFDAAVSEATLASVVPLSEAAADVAARRPEWTRYPHIVFRDGGLLFTSVHLGLRKNARQHV